MNIKLQNNEFANAWCNLQEKRFSKLQIQMQLLFFNEKNGFGVHWEDHESLLTVFWVWALFYV